MQNYETDGYWWIPGEDDKKVAGVVRFDDDGINLRLFGAFTQEDTPSRWDELRPLEAAEIINGSCDGREVTLIQARQTCHSSTTGQTESRHQEFEARYMLIGVWLQSPTERIFDRIDLEIENTLTWARTSVFNVEPDDEHSDGRSIRWQFPAKTKAKVGEASVELNFHVRSGAQSRAAHTREYLEESVAFSVEVPEPKCAKCLTSEWTRPLQDLVTFATDRPSGLSRVQLFLHQNGIDPEKRVPRAEVDVYFPALLRSTPEAEAVRDTRLLFTLDDMPFSDAVPTWLEVREELGPVVAMLLGQRYRNTMYAENKLITSVTAAEALHRRILPGNTTLETRLNRLVEYVGVDIVRPFMPDPTRWALRASSARNKLAHHYETDLQGGDLSNNAIITLSQMATNVVTLAILKKIGLDDDHLTQIANEKYWFEWVALYGPHYDPWTFGGEALVPEVCCQDLQNLARIRSAPEGASDRAHR